MGSGGSERAGSGSGGSERAIPGRARAGSSTGLQAARELAERLRARDLTAAAAALNMLESTGEQARAQADELLEAVSPAELGAEAPGRIVGITGPPGVGKSTLISGLLGIWRADGRTAAVLAVDPSSRRSGGSLLGDRARIDHDPGDPGVFIRSTAAGERLGGLAPATRPAATTLAAAFDVVVIETVGVGQSETEVADVADAVVVVVQPASGDVLQFLKAGIMEIPDVLVVNKSDLGEVALRAAADLEAALASLGHSSTPVLSVCATGPDGGLRQLAEAIDRHLASLELERRRARARRMQALAEFAAEHGAAGLRALGGRAAAERWLSQLDGSLAASSMRRELERRAGRSAGR